MLLIVLGFILVFLVVRHFTWKPLSWPEGSLRPSKYQGHRGYWKGGQQENSMPSFEAAKARSLTMIEFDVHLSKDEVPVIFHDSDLKRIAGLEDKVYNLTAKELLEKANAPSLAQVLESNKIPSYLNIELKTDKVLCATLEKKVAEVVHAHKASERVMFSSFNPLSLARLRRYIPEVPRALLVSQEPEPGNRIYLRKMWFAPYVGVHLLHLDFNDVSEADLRGYKSRGIPVALWTVNDRAVAEKFLAAGAVSIISDELF